MEVVESSQVTSPCAGRGTLGAGQQEQRHTGATAADALGSALTGEIWVAPGRVCGGRDGEAPCGPYIRA